MNYFKYNKVLLAYERINPIKYILLIGLAFIAVILLSSFIYNHEVSKVYIKAEKEIILKNKDEFSNDKLIKLIKELHIKHPEIVYSQFVIESGHFKSMLFKTQNNIMGMRIAKTRPTTSIAERNGYSVYNTWRDCVIDYALYQSSFLHGVNKDDYYQYLNEIYAENPNYVKEIKSYINKNKVKELFK